MKAAHIFGMKNHTREMNAFEFYAMTEPVVYAWFRNNDCLYVGQSVKGFVRLTRHHVIGKIDEVQASDSFRFWFSAPFGLDALEKELIIELKPLYNQAHTNNGKAQRHGHCQWCGKEYQANTTWQKYCRKECKNAAFWKENNGAPVTQREQVNKPKPTVACVITFKDGTKKTY